MQVRPRSAFSQPCLLADRREFYWFEAFALARRAILVVFKAQVNDPGKMCAITLFNLLAFLVQVICRPFKNRVDNVLELISLLFILVVSIVITAFRHPPEPYSTGVQIAFLVLAVGPGAFLFACVAFFTIR